MLLTNEGLRERKAWPRPAQGTGASLKMVSMKTESMKQEPRSEPKAGLRAGLRAGPASSGRGGQAGGAGGGAEGYSRAPAAAGEGSTDTGGRGSLAMKSWMLVRRDGPSAVEMTLLARGRAGPPRGGAEPSRSDTDAALPWLASEGRGAEPLTRVLSALRRLGRAILGEEPAVPALPLAERRMPRPPEDGPARSLAAVGEESQDKGVGSAGGFSRTLDYTEIKQNTSTTWANTKY